MQYRVQFADEAPAIGSGWRGVAEIKVGRKWVTIVETATGYKARTQSENFEKVMLLVGTAHNLARSGIAGKLPPYVAQRFDQLSEGHQEYLAFLVRFAMEGWNRK